MKITPKLLKEMGFKRVLQRGESEFWYLPDTQLQSDGYYQFEFSNRKFAIKELYKLVLHIARSYYDYGQQDKEAELKKALGIKT